MPRSPARTGSAIRRLRPILLGLIVLGAFVLRVTFNTYQLPPYWDYPNEIDKMVDVLALEELGFYHGYMQPSFLMNTMWLWYQPAQAVFPWVNATFPGFRPLEGGMEGWLLWLGRVYMALFGAATVWLVYFVGRRIGSARLGLTAALLLAVTPIHVLGSRHMKEDMPLAFFVTLALLFLLDVVRRGARRDYLRAGLAAGLAFSTKWIGISILAPFLLAGLLAIPRTRRNWPAPGRRWLIPLVLAGFVAGFFLASPDYILAGRMNIIWEGPQKGMTKAYDAHADGIAVDAYREAYVDYFRKGIWPGLTPALILLAGIGFGSLWRRRRSAALLLGFWVVFFYILIESARARPYPHFERYLQPITPTLIVFAACGVEAARRSALRLLRQRRGLPPLRRAVAPALLCLALAWPLADTIRYLEHIPRSTVLQAREWIMQHVPPGAIIYDDSYGPGFPEGRYERRKYRSKDQLIVGAFPTEPCYVMYTSMGLGRFVEHPEANPGVARWVFYVLSKGRLTKEWTPEFRSFYAESPLIKLYRFEPSPDPLVVEY